MTFQMIVNGVLIGTATACAISALGAWSRGDWWNVGLFLVLAGWLVWIAFL